VDFHAADLDGEPLIARAPIAYPLDVPREEPASADTDRALVVSDPTLDLEAARREGEHVERVLREHAWEVDGLGGAAATSASVRGGLGKARLLHYAGHGVFAGHEAWESALPLASGGTLTIADILAAPKVPERIVLSGCDTAREAMDAPMEGLGMAQAFVVRGASFVIAPTRPVDDRLAPRLAAALYGGLADHGPVDAATVLRDAQLRLRAEDPSLDWSAFRLVTR
jgi:CHAT domain-containing protein